MLRKYEELVKAAKMVKRNAYAPFSRFRVGAALLTNEGRIYTGCNVENSSFSLTICAERTALFNAISDGAKKFKAIAIISDDPGFTPPCGACRQVLSDLARNIDFVMVNSRDQIKIVKLKTLLPLTFTAKNIKHSNKITIQ